MIFALTCVNRAKMNPILEPLTFPDRQVQEESVVSTQCECLFCSEVFDLKTSNDQILAHFLLSHKLVVADVKEIVDFKRFITLYVLFSKSVH